MSPGAGLERSLVSPIAAVSAVLLGLFSSVAAMRMAGSAGLGVGLAVFFIGAELTKVWLHGGGWRLRGADARSLLAVVAGVSVIGSILFLSGARQAERPGIGDYGAASSYVDADVWLRTNGCRKMRVQDRRANQQCSEIPDFLLTPLPAPRQEVPAGWLALIAALQAASMLGALRPAWGAPGEAAAPVAPASPSVSTGFSRRITEERAPSPATAPSVARLMPPRTEQHSESIFDDYEEVLYEEIDDSHDVEVDPVTTEQEKPVEREPEKEPEKEKDLVSAGRFIYGAAVKPSELEYLWPDMLVSGDFNLIGGEGGVGKSSIVATIAAMTTKTGARWPTGEPVQSGSVVMCEIEDPLDSVTVPRLLAAGANMSRIALCDESIDFAQHIDELTAIVDRLEQATSTAVRLLTLSPVRQFFGDKEVYNDSQIRHRLTKLLAFAKARRICVLGVIHPKPGKEAFAGSEAWKNRARSGIFAKKMDEGGQRRVIFPLKANNGPDDWYIPYRAVGADVSGYRTNKILWGDKVILGGLTQTQQQPEGDESVKAEGTMPRTEARAKPLSAKERAKRFIQAALGEGPLDGAALKRDAAAANPPIGESTMEEAAVELGVVRDGLGIDGRPRKSNSKLWCTPSQFAEREKQRAKGEDKQGD